MSGRWITLSDARRLFCVSSVLYGLLTTGAWAQRSVTDNLADRHDVVTVYHSAVGTGVVVFTVFAENTRTHLDRQALLRLVNQANHTATWQTTEETSQGVFTNIPFGSYAVEVSAVGYLSTQKELQVMNTVRPALIDIVLQRDPSAINLDVTDRILSPKARKETKRAVSALKSGNFRNAQKELDEAHKSAPSSADLNFLLGYLYFQKKDFEKASNYLGTATSLNPRDAQSLTLLGRAGLERQDYVAARSALERAVAAAPKTGFHTICWPIATCAKRIMTRRETKLRSRLAKARGRQVRHSLFWVRRWLGWDSTSKALRPWILF